MKTKKEICDWIDNRLDMVSKDHWINMIVDYLSTDEMIDLLDCNEMTPRFYEGEDE